MNILEELADPARISERLEFHRRLVAEAQEAAAICDRVLHGPASWWRNALVQADGSKTAGMVTVLIERAVVAIQQSPPDALALTEIAIELAGTMEADEYPYAHVQKIRGHALREQAWVLSCMGRHQQAARLADLAAMFFEEIPEPLRELGRLDLVRSNIARSTESYGRAVEYARQAAERFLACGARTSWLNARFFEASAHFSAGEVAKALEIYRSMADGTRLLTQEQRAARIHNMAACMSASGRFEEAARLYARAAAEFERQGATTNRVKCGYSIGFALNETGKYEEAIAVLLKAEVELDALGLGNDAALAALARVEALLALGRTYDVAETCRGLVRRFTDAGVKSAAMTALAYLRETLATGHATPASVRHVHDFLRDTTLGTARGFTPYREV